LVVSLKEKGSSRLSFEENGALESKQGVKIARAKNKKCSNLCWATSSKAAM